MADPSFTANPARPLHHFYRLDPVIAHGVHGGSPAADHRRRGGHVSAYMRSGPAGAGSADRIRA